MRRAVLGVAVARPIVDRHGPVGAHRQHEQELLKVRAMVCVAAVVNGQGPLAAQRATPRPPVLARQRDGRRVVMQLGQVHAEGRHRAHDHLREERRPVGVEQPIEGAPDLIIGERGHLGRPQPEQRRHGARGPLRLGVERHAPQQEVAHEDAQGRGRGEPLAPVARRDVLGQEVAEPQPREDVIDERQRVDAAGLRVNG